MAVSIQQYKKALVALEEALVAEKTNLNRDATIQRFEFCVELGWKTAKKKMGTSTSAPKDVIREMAQSGYIEDVVFWLQAIDKRNLSSHTYDENLANEVYDFAKQFLGSAFALLSKLDS